MPVQRKENLVAPFSHALHLFRPDPQRSICIGKRNHERLRAAVLVRLLRGQLEELQELESSGCELCRARRQGSRERPPYLVQPPISGPGRPARQTGPGSVEESCLLTVELCSCRLRAPFM